MTRLRRPGPARPSRTIRVDPEVYAALVARMRPGESLQAAVTRIVREALAEEGA
jgi:hypothetical protein